MTPQALEAPPAEDTEPEEDTTVVNGLSQDHFDALNPCAVCGVMSHEGPEREYHSGFGHCWKCGYRPGVQMPPALPQARTGLTGAQIEALTNDLRRGVVEDILAALKGGATLDQVTAEYTPPEAADAAPVQ